MRSVILLMLVTLLVPAPARAELISTEQEVAIGREAAAKFEQRYGLVQDPAMQERLNRIGQQLAAYSGRTDIAYSFKVANMDDFNALAFPGGFIYATRGLMQALPDPELAFVIGHEITHVARRHSVRQLEKSLYTQLGLLALVTALSEGRVSQGSAAAAQLANAVISSQYSQADERESDAIGIQLMAKAGYDPVYAVSALNILAQHAGGTPGFLNSLVGSHPLPADRIADASAAVPGIPFDTGIRNTPAAAVDPWENVTIDTDWQNDLFWTMKQAGTGLSPDQRLMNNARRLAVAPQSTASGPRGATLAIQIPAPASSVQGESILLGRELPNLLARYRYTRYGLAVARTQGGLRQIIVMLE